MSRRNNHQMVWQMCSRKTAYYSAKDAKRGEAQKNMRAYQCPHCDKWHLTSKFVEKPKRES